MLFKWVYKTRIFTKGGPKLCFVFLSFLDFLNLLSQKIVTSVNSSKRVRILKAQGQSTQCKTFLT